MKVFKHLTKTDAIISANNIFLFPARPGQGRAFHKMRTQLQKSKGEQDMSYETLIVEKQEKYLLITLNRPPMNPISPSLLDDLNAALDEHGNDDDILSIIITGAGEKAFCAGADLKAGFGDDPGKLAKKGQSTFDRLESLGKPVIAAINGITLGGGCELSLACTFRLIDEKAIIGLPESNLGIIPGYGGTQRLSRLIGKPKALNLIIFGKHVDAAKAVELGIADTLCAHGTVLDEAKKLASLIATRAPVATRMILDAVNRGVEETLEDGLEIERDNFSEVMKSEDAKEGITAFLEKRKPDFKGK